MINYNKSRGLVALIAVMGLCAIGCKTSSDPTSSSVAVRGVSLNKSALSLEVGETEQLTATVVPANAKNKALSWESDNTVVATVAADGTVSAIAAGTAKITVTTAEGGFQAFCQVTVNSKPPTPVAVSGVSLNKNTLSLEVDETEKLTATIEPGNAANQALSWESDKPAVATVAADGTVSAIAAGTAKITVITADGGFQAFCQVTVKPKAGIIEVYFNNGDTHIDISTDSADNSISISKNEKLLVTVEGDFDHYVWVIPANGTECGSDENTFEICARDLWPGTFTLHILCWKGSPGITGSVPYSKELTFKVAY